MTITRGSSYLFPAKNLIIITAKMYECQDSMKKLFEDKDPTMIATHAKIIRENSAVMGLDTLTTVLHLCKSINESLPVGTGVTIALLMAAAVEMLEGKA
jgi:hypothetical protein